MVRWLVLLVSLLLLLAGGWSNLGSSRQNSMQGQMLILSFDSRPTNRKTAA